MDNGSRHSPVLEAGVWMSGDPVCQALDWTLTGTSAHGLLRWSTGQNTNRVRWKRRAVGKACISMAEAQAQDILEAWRLDDNPRHPHRALGHLTPPAVVAPRRVIQAAEEAGWSREASSWNGANVRIRLSEFLDHYYFG